MSKEISLNVRIDTKGRLHVKPDGTQGEECVDLMEFIKTIPGLSIVETQRVDTDRPGDVHLRQQNKA
jgi:hypothetical protein